MNPLLQSISHMDATIESLLETRPESVVIVENDGDYVHISVGDDGLTLSEDEAKEVADKLIFALQDREKH